MPKKIKVAVVDDDDSLHDVLLDLYRDSDKIEIKYNYTESRKFISEAPNLDFDICFLDISMPELDGLTLAQLLKNKAFIFITGSDDKLKDALGLKPIDVVTKPFTKDRLDHAIEKAIKLISERIDNALFNVAESEKKINISLPDIVFVNTDEIDPRHKNTVMKDGTKYTIMDRSLDELLSFASHLVQVNKCQLVSLSHIEGLQFDVITVKNGKSLGVPQEITLGRTYKKEVLRRYFYK